MGFIVVVGKDEDFFNVCCPDGRRLAAFEGRFVGRLVLTAEGFFDVGHVGGLLIGNLVVVGLGLFVLTASVVAVGLLFLADTAYLGVEVIFVGLTVVDFLRRLSLLKMWSGVGFR